MSTALIIALLKIIIVFAGSLFFFLFMKLAYKCLRANESEYRRAHQTGSLKDAFKGTIIPQNGVSSCLIREGLAIDKKKKKIVPQGTLSDDALNSLLR